MSKQPITKIADDAPITQGDIDSGALILRKRGKKFAKIIAASDGRQVLFYVAKSGGSFVVHQIVNIDGSIADLERVFDLPSSGDNECLAYAALDVADQSSADKIISSITEIIGEKHD